MLYRMASNTNEKAYFHAETYGEHAFGHVRGLAVAWCRPDVLRPGRRLVLGVRVYVLLIYLHTYTHRRGMPAVGSVPGVGRGAGAVAGPVAVLCRCCASVLVLVLPRVVDCGRLGLALNKLRGYLCERSSGGSFAGSADRVKRIFCGVAFSLKSRAVFLLVLGVVKLFLQGRICERFLVGGGGLIAVLSRAVPQSAGPVLVVNRLVFVLIRIVELRRFAGVRIVRGAGGAVFVSSVRILSITTYQGVRLGV